jgi:hypothetical protein
MGHSKTTIWAALVVALATTGCSSSGVPGAYSDPLLRDDGEQLASLERSDWGSATEGCAGMLGEGLHFAIASAEDGLIAAVEADGDVLCVDTVEAVEEELEESGRVEEARTLVNAFHATLQAARTGVTRLRGGTREGDPDPEPNVTWTRFQLRGDPDPEPNSGF